MEQNGTDFEWTAQREEAALLVAQDQLSDQEIAGELGIGRTTLHRWKADPAFDARVQEHRALWAERIKARGIAERQNRVDALNRRWDLLHQVIDERAKDPTVQDVPGGKTGLLVRQVKGVGKGDDFHLVELYAVDSGTLKELREHEKQAAQELGQWTEKRDVTSDGKSLHIELRGEASLKDL